MSPPRRTRGKKRIFLAEQNYVSRKGKRPEGQSAISTHEEKGQALHLLGKKFQYHSLPKRETVTK